jgi:transposase InsO family protein
MYLHANAKLGLAGRFALVKAIEQGMTSPATAHRWWHRWLEAGEEARRTLSCLLDRSSRPRRSPGAAGAGARGGDLCLPPGQRLGAEAGRGRDRVCALDGLEGPSAGGDLAAARAGKEPAHRYEWPCPGDLLHMDTSRYARFVRPGHRVTGDRSQRSRHWMRAETRVGCDYAHAILDDHSRLAFVELHEDEKAATVTGFVERALAFFAEHGMTAKRLMTDNGFSYVKNRSLRGLLARQGIRHLITEPYRPRTNGKVERFHQTMAREWAYGLSYRSHRQRNQALPHWLDHYNTRRPHSSLGARPPISRVHNVRGQDSQPLRNRANPQHPLTMNARSVVTSRRNKFACCRRVVSAHEPDSYSDTAPGGSVPPAKRLCHADPNAGVFERVPDRPILSSWRRAQARPARHAARSIERVGSSARSAGPRWGSRVRTVEPRTSPENASAGSAEDLSPGLPRRSSDRS